MKEGKIDLLVLPVIFPQDRNDILGIFVLDYLKAVKDRCNITVLDIHMAGGKKGLHKERDGDITIIRYGLTQTVPGRFLKPFFYLLWLYKGWRLASLVDNVDVIHAHGSTLMGTLALLISATKQAPVIVTEHSPVQSIRGRWLLRLLTARVMAKVNIVAFVSENLRREVEQEGFRPLRSEVTFNPVDTDVFRIASDDALVDRKNIVYVGRLEPYKGGLRALTAFQRIAARYPKWSMTVIGGGREFSAIQRIADEDENLRGRVRVMGQLDKARIALEMNRASFLAFPSEHETFGLVAAEAMACGLPVIIGSGTGSTEFVTPESGLVVPAMEIDKIATAMEQLIGNLGAFDPQGIRATIVSRFGFREFGKRMNDLYASLI